VTTAAACAAIVKRELVSTLRQGRAYAAFVAIVLVTVVFIVTAWPSEQSLFYQAPALAAQLTVITSYVLLAGSVLLIPAIAANSIALEREQQTYDMLHMTAIPSFAVLGAKILNSLGLYALIVVGVLPVVGTAFFLVGVETNVLLTTLALVLASTFTSAAIATWVSARSRTTVRAIIISYIAVAVFHLLSPFALFLGWTLFVALFLDIGSIGSGAQGAAITGSPFLAFQTLHRGTLLPTDLAYSLGYQISVAAVGLFFASRALRKPLPERKADTDKPIDDPEELKRRRMKFPFYLIDPLRRKGTIEDGRNPMLVRELRWGLMQRGGVMIRAFYGSFFVILVGGFFSLLDANGISVDVSTSWIWFEMVLVVLVAPALTANVLTKEYELGNMDMLRMTLVPPRQIIAGKGLAGAMAVSPVVCAALLMNLILAPAGQGIWPVLLTGTVSVIACAALSLALSLVASYLMTRTTGALVVSYVLSAIVFLGVPFTASYVLSYRGYWSTVTESAAAFVSPIQAFQFNIDSQNGNSWPDDPNLFNWLLPHWSSSAFTLYWMANVLVFFLVATGIMYVTAREFERWRMQDR